MKTPTKGVIAAGSIEVAQAGADILKAGGNAFDAAIAATWMTFVAEPTATSAGGGGFMNVHTKDGENILFDFFVQTPYHKKPIEALDFYPVELDYGGHLQTFYAGLASIGIPSNIAGLFHVHQKLGSLPMDILMQPAIEKAKNGIEIRELLRYCIELVAPAAGSKPSGAALYTPNGRLPQLGEIFYNRDFADFLSVLAKEGHDLFYKGEVAQQIVKTHQEQGGYLTMEDFENYRVLERNPLMVPYRNHVVSTNPPPSAGGCMAAFTLKMMEHENLSQHGFGSGTHLNLLSNAMRVTKMARQENFDHASYDPDIRERFFSDQHLDLRTQSMLEVACKMGSTTHLSVADEHNNIVSITTSLGEGSGYVPEGTGIMMNNMLGEEDLNPGGFHLWPTNRRMTSMMTPSILLKDGKAVLATGSGGANRIRSVISQVISNHVDFGMDIKENVQSPRIHWEDDKLDIEPGLNSENISQVNMPVSPNTVVWDKKAFYFGGAHSIAINQNGEITGHGDERRTGAVAIIE